LSACPEEHGNDYKKYDYKETYEGINELRKIPLKHSRADKGQY